MRYAGQRLAVAAARSLGIGALLLAPPARSQTVAAHSAAACAVRIASSDTLRFADGRTLSVDPQSLATDGHAVIGLGSHTHIWKPGALAGAMPVDEGSAIGFLPDKNGDMRPVPNPLPGSRVEYPRVASAGVAGWHVVFVTLPPSVFGDPVRLDSATVWYGLFDGTQWHGVERIASVADANLSPSLSSQLVVLGETLNFAFPFDASIRLNSNKPGTQGIIMLQRRGSRWLADTLRTWSGPNSVGLVPDPVNHSVTAVIVQSYFEDHRFWASTLFLAGYDRGWSTPRRVAGDGHEPIIDAPSIALLGHGRVFLSWAAAEISNPASTHVEWAVAPRDGLGSMTHSPIARGSGVEDFAAVALDTNRVLWLLRNGSSQASVRVVLGDAAHDASELGTLDLPMDTPRPRAIALSRSMAVLVTSRLPRPRRNRS